MPAPSFVLLLSLLAAEEVPSKVFDEVLLKDGSRLVGEIVDMRDSMLTVDTAFGGKIKVKWEEVESIKTAGPIPILLKDGTLLNGVVDGAKDGRLTVKSDTLAQPAS